ncbi:ATP-binding cassette domain-containing protein [Coprobacillaceae bacterium CR2/5/TPMF4]|nr:ATP-binding cassette domain-containing protein [Coprobacillaceae bacterium CR2/5/TPMF4]
MALGKINEIELSNLTFAYKQDNVLENINLKINEPGIYGVVGSSGSGKSTIAKLLLGYFDHYQGSLTYNGLQVKEINHHDLMKQITLVEHNPYIFAGTVRSNLLDGNCYASDEQLMAVLEKVNLLNYFKELDGLDSEIEERGNNLSGGQKQRLSIARALLHDSGVYIFDEATSNIDIESEEIIMQVIEAMKKDKIVILISHRLANVVNCKCNYVFSHGKLIGNGSHDQLMQENQEYHQLVKTQQEIENYGGKTSEKA